MASRVIEVSIDITWAVSRTDGLPFSTQDTEKVNRIVKGMADAVKVAEIEGFTIKSVGSEIKPTILDRDAEELARLCDELGLLQSALDSTIHDLLSEDASTINNGGFPSQINELIRRLGVAEAKSAIMAAKT